MLPLCRLLASTSILAKCSHRSPAQAVQRLQYLSRNVRQSPFTFPGRKISSIAKDEAVVPPVVEADNDTYHGPLAPTIRRLKVFSLGSLAMSFTMAPFFFIVESSLPVTARIALAGSAMVTSGISTGIVAWIGGSYVSTLRHLRPSENDGIEGLEMTTMTLTLQPRVTRIYDTNFLVETNRPFAKWELSKVAITPMPSPGREEVHKAFVPGKEETVAETMDKTGAVVGKWIVKWEENGTGTCRQVGNVVRFFNVHEELLVR